MTSAHRTVIHRTHDWLPQTQTWIYTQVQYLPADVECHIVCDRTHHLDQFGLPNIHCLWEESRWRYLWDKGLQKLRLRRYLGYLVAQARRYDVDIVHAHFGGVGWRNMGAAKKVGARYVVTFYGADVNQLPRSVPRWYRRYRQLFDHVDRVLCEGPHMAQSIINLGCPEDKVRVHHLGVRVDNIPYQPRKWKPDELFRVLIASSFREKKGIPYALEALGRLQNNVQLGITLIGDADKGPRSQLEKQKILATIEKYGLGPKVRLLGYQPHDVLLEEASRHHIFLSPSVTAADGDAEGGAPVSIIEMMATGMPVVSSRHCDIPEIVHHMETGLLAEERDVDGLVQHLKWLVAHPDQWAPMLTAGREHVEVEYNARVQGQHLAEIYQELL